MSKSVQYPGYVEPIQYLPNPLPQWIPSYPDTPAGRRMFNAAQSSSQSSFIPSVQGPLIIVTLSVADNLNVTVSGNQITITAGVG